MSNSPIKIFTIFVIVFIVFLASVYYLRNKKEFDEATLDQFAKCLADKGAVMYGAYWCPHCQNEKKAFGDSFRFVPYVECTEESQKCVDAKITGYPTWILAGDKVLEGEQGLEKLSVETGCSLPQTK